MKRLFAWLTVLPVVAFAACGGKVTFDGLPGSKGSGGSGGTGPSSASVSNVSISAVTDVATDSTIVVTVGPSSSVDVTSSTGQTSFDAISTTSTGPSSCDNSGDCNNDDNSCITCATEVGGPCSADEQMCESSPDCVSFSKCVDNCGGSQNCTSACEGTYPLGFTEYETLVTCVVCQACLHDCANMGFACDD